ncbi:MAG: hypothetical protein ACSLE5_06410 [Porticoccaceae bacterium]
MWWLIRSLGGGGRLMTGAGAAAQIEDNIANTPKTPIAIPVASAWE